MSPRGLECGLLSSIGKAQRFLDTLLWQLRSMMIRELVSASWRSRRHGMVQVTDGCSTYVGASGVYGKSSVHGTWLISLTRCRGRGATNTKGFWIDSLRERIRTQMLGLQLIT